MPCGGQSAYNLEPLKYDSYTMQKNTQMYILAGFAIVIVLVLYAPKIRSEIPGTQAATTATSTAASIARGISARIAGNSGDSDTVKAVDKAESTGGTLKEDIANAKTIEQSSSNKDAYKSMSDDEKKKVEATTRKLIKKHDKLIVMLFAPWCPHCHDMMPVMAKTAKANPGVNFLFVNAETLPRSAFQGDDAIFNLEYFPSVCKKKNGKLEAVTTDLEEAVKEVEGTDTSVVKASVASVKPEKDMFADLF